MSNVQPRRQLSLNEFYLEPERMELHDTLGREKPGKSRIHVMKDIPHNLGRLVVLQKGLPPQEIP